MRWTLPLLFACKTQELTPCGDPCILQDSRNFQYQSTIEIERYAREPLVDLQLEWWNLSTGIQNNSIDPVTDIDEVILVVFSSMGPDAVEQGLATDTLQQADVSTYMLCAPEENQAQCTLSEFGLLGSYPGMHNYFDEDSGTWMVALQSDDLAGAQTLAFLEPTSGASTNAVTIDDQSTQVFTDVDLSSLPPLGLHETGHVDWSQLTLDGYGNPMSIHTLSELQIGRYDESLDDISERFVELDSLVDETWLADVEGRTDLDLSELIGSRTFPGVDNESRWLLALRCGSCDSPVPRVLMVLAPAGSH